MTANAMCCIPGPARRRYGRKSPCTILRQSGRWYGKRCSGSIRHGLTDIMPALCNVDYASMELLHARLVRTTTCVDGCRCDYTICGDKDPYLKERPEYRDEAGFRRNK